MVNGMQRKEPLRIVLKAARQSRCASFTRQPTRVRCCVFVLKAALYVRYLLQPVTRAGDAGLETHGGRLTHRRRTLVRASVPWSKLD